MPKAKIFKFRLTWDQRQTTRDEFSPISTYVNRGYTEERWIIAPDRFIAKAHFENWLSTEKNVSVECIEERPPFAVIVEL